MLLFGLESASLYYDYSQHDEKAPIAKETSKDSNKIRWATETETTGRKKRKTPTFVSETSSKALYQKDKPCPSRASLGLVAKTKAKSTLV
ncbi:MAG: hypothetical protein AOA66_0073 [Candidatus Bathyarchaeota archaeon BA2]|nr:MAG: hypothetical protein AOA66_0073 [Candidatus Bathyarchaeota archaeon BA2]